MGTYWARKAASDQQKPAITGQSGHKHTDSLISGFRVQALGRTKIFDWWVASNRWGLDVESSDYYYPCKYRFGYQAQNYVALFSKLVELPLADLLVLQPHVYGEGVEE